MSFQKRSAWTLYYFAWGVEVIAVTIGLFIALAIGYDAWLSIMAAKQVSFSDHVNVIIAALPFVLVAVVEITKIPMAGAAYKAQTPGWRILFTLVLLFLAGITFETAFNGFERAFTNLKFSIENKMNQLSGVEERLELLVGRKTSLEQLTPESIEARYNDRHATIRDERDDSLGKIQAQIDELKAKSQSVYIDNTKDERAELIRQRQELLAARQKAAEAAAEDFAADIRVRRQAKEDRRARILKQIDALQAQVLDFRQELAATKGVFARGQRKRLNGQIDALTARRLRLEGELARVGAVSALGRDEAVAAATSEYQRRLEALDRRINRLNKDIGTALAKREAGLENELAPLYADLARINAAFAAQQAENTAEREADYVRLRAREPAYQALLAEINDREERRLELRNAINLETRSNQVYRITQSWTGADSATDLHPDQVARTAVVWFGSLGAVVALTGILLALAAYVVEDADKPKPAKSPLTKLVNSLRRMLVGARRLQRRERTVVEGKIKEVLVKELVHVPLVAREDDLALEAVKASRGSITGLSVATGKRRAEKQTDPDPS